MCKASETFGLEPEMSKPKMRTDFGQEGVKSSERSCSGDGSGEARRLGRPAEPVELVRVVEQSVLDDLRRLELAQVAVPDEVGEHLAGF